MVSFLFLFFFCIFLLFFFLSFFLMCLVVLLCLPLSSWNFCGKKLESLLFWGCIHQFDMHMHVWACVGLYFYLCTRMFISDFYAMLVLSLVSMCCWMNIFTYECVHWWRNNCYNAHFNTPSRNADKMITNLKKKKKKVWWVPNDFH